MEESRKKVLFYGFFVVFGLFLVIWTATGRMASPFGEGGFGMWLAAFMSICILSFLYDDNPIYKFAEAIFIGCSAAYFMVQGVWEQLIKNLLIKIAPEVAIHLVDSIEPQEAWIRYYYFIPLILGILLLWRLAPSGGWVARWPLAFIVGWTAGTNLERYLTSDFARQIDPTLIPMVVVQDGSVMWMASLSNTVLVAGVLCALIYFFFSVEHRGAFGVASRTGIWVLMITFGAAFGYTVMGRIALLVGRMEFLFVDWMQIFSPPT